MSLIITVFVREGLVMAADSRLTLSAPRALPDCTTQTLSITSSDSAKKLFLAPNHVGISTCGVADIGGVPIAGFVESFIVEKLKGKSLGPADVSSELSAYFRDLSVRPGTMFHVAGYVSTNSILEQAIFLLEPASGLVQRQNNPTTQGATWNGEVDVLQRLYTEVLLVQPAPLQPVPIASFGVPFQYFTLQDAIDFAVHGVRSTIETLRFQFREKTVGGPIDVLVIQPDSAQWISHKGIEVPK